MASIIERKNKAGVVTRYQVKWREKGQQHNDSFDSLAKAEMFKKVLELNEHDGDKAYSQILRTASRAPSIEQVAVQHLRRLSDITVHTMHTYERMIENHFKGNIGDIPCDMLSEEDIAEWVMWMRGKDLSPKTIKNVHGFLYSVMGTAIYKGHRPDNPCEHTRLPKSDHTEDKTTFLTKAEFALILSHLDQYFHPFFLLLVGTGMRFSEATALQPGDFSDEQGTYTARVTKAWKRDDKNGRKIGPPKTENARRTIPLTADLAKKIAFQVSITELDEYVFTMKEGGAATVQAMHNKAWKPALRAAKKSGLKKSPRIHDLRHTYASWMLSGDNPMSIFELSRLMGHESVNTTTKVYSHLMRESLVKGADVMGNAMSGLFNIQTVKKVEQSKAKAIEQ
ncbi:site-specific integrase [Arthrobacter sp. S41]|uniref:tyrosine-type recombinase/integrase n=1 Tax=Arthrobacter sp. S41 TaxID=2509721 RepID=UPI0010363979|nr:site-specific integrase [Arthrobacter sp. S41]TAP26817.1 site-specific integrase [Arthrobacter sp. S41]